MVSRADKIKKDILGLVREYSKLKHGRFRPGYDLNRPAWQKSDGIQYSGRVFDDEELVAGVSNMLEFWLTLGSEGQEFEHEIATFLGVRSSVLVNSGSSANLVALATLTSWKLPRERRIEVGDEVITVASGFPTTVSPIVQVGAVPVFIDANPLTGNAVCGKLNEAYIPGKTKAVILAHALGNPFDIRTTLEFCRDKGLWLIEDNCDALGSSYSMPKKTANRLGIYQNSPGLDEGPERIARWTGTWGDISTQSFYPPHHITMGEGGCVNIVSSQKLRRIAESFRDWGRDCWCPSGIDNTCQKRFEWKLGDLPEGYDHKYIYSHLGYNLKPLDLQAAIGRVQLRKLTEFIRSRSNNWLALRQGLDKYCEHLKFALPTHAVGWDNENGFIWDDSECMVNCSWFGFSIGVGPEAMFTRSDIMRALNNESIGFRMPFGGNLLKQPAFVELKKANPSAYRAVGKMSGSDQIMNNYLFIGNYPGLTAEMINHQIDVISSVVESRSASPR